MKLEKAKDVQNANKFNEDQNLAIQHFIGMKKDKRVEEAMLGKRTTMESSVS